MKNLVPIGMLTLLVGMTAVTAGQEHGGQENIRERFAGAWRLVWLEQPGADGKPHRMDCRGLFVFTRDGHLSVQVMEHNAPAQTAAGPEQYAQGGYEASWGTYQVDQRAHTFTFHVEGALVRTLIGKDLQRVYEFSGKRLMVKSTRPDEHWRAAWERY